MRIKFGHRDARRLSLAGVLSGGFVATACLFAGGAATTAAAQADPCPNAAVRTGPSAALPDCRAYEMVSPLDKNGGNIDRDVVFRTYAAFGASVDGGAVAYTSKINFGEADGAAHNPVYLAERRSEGWSSQGVHLPVGPNPFPVLKGFDGFSPDLSRGVGFTNALLTPQADLLNGSYGLYMRANVGVPGSYELLSAPSSLLTPEETSSPAASSRFQYAAMTPDATHVVFESSRQLLPEGPPDNSSASTKNAVYEFVNGDLRLVSALSPEPGRVWAGRFSNAASGLRGDHSISDDGRRIFFGASAGGTGGPLYVREDATTTTTVSVSERALDAGTAKNGVFWGAASDGSIAFFTSFEPLTDDAVADGSGVGGKGSDIYRWDASAPAGQRLTDLTTADPAGSGVLTGINEGPVAITDDATHAYFAATGALTPEATRGDHNLYLWKQGEGVRFVAGLDPARDRSVWTIARDDDLNNDARASADGERLLFSSAVQLTAYDTAGHRQLYLYDAAANEGAGQITCVSCNPLASSSSSDVRMLDFETTFSRAPDRLIRNLSDHGTRAFFETREKLVAQDLNGTKDVYQWHDPDLDGTGELAMISAGRCCGDSKLLDATPDGSEVYFTTRDRLVAGDIDNQGDLYVAKTNGGFPEQRVPAPCVGSACQGDPSSPPEATSPASAAFAGPGNPIAEDDGTAKRCRRLDRRHDEAKRKSKKAKRKARQAKRKAKRASGKTAKRLEEKADEKLEKAKKAKRKAKRLKRKAKRCKRGDR